MEIYRSDSGGRYAYNERLLKVFANVYNKDSSIFEYVEKIIDHKGDLEIHLNSYFLEFKYVYSLFFVEWHNQNECNVTIAVDNVGVYGYLKGKEI